MTAIVTAAFNAATKGPHGATGWSLTRLSGTTPFKADCKAWYVPILRRSSPTSIYGSPNHEQVLGVHMRLDSHAQMPHHCECTGSILEDVGSEIFQLLWMHRGVRLFRVHSSQPPKSTQLTVFTLLLSYIPCDCKYSARFSWCFFCLQLPSPEKRSEERNCNRERKAY